MGRVQQRFHCILLHILLYFTHILSKQDVKVITKPFYLDENVFFELLEPTHISYTYKIRPAKDFGIVLNRTLTNVELVPSVPIHGCSRFTNRYDIQNTIALIQRGGCSFLSKTINAEQAGALAAIIFDHEIDNEGKMIDMIQDDTKRTTKIPAFFLQGRDGMMIKNGLEQHQLPSALINIPINMTGIPIRAVNQPPWTLW